MVMMTTMQCFGKVHCYFGSNDSRIILSLERLGSSFVTLNKKCTAPYRAFLRFASVVPLSPLSSTPFFDPDDVLFL